jgi:DNA integrity scanning protein DisA with diadenylate cyclase activity
MTPPKLGQQFATVLDLAVDLVAAVDADALLVMVEAPVEWEQLKKATGDTRLVVAADAEEDLAGAKECGLDCVYVNLPEAPIHDKLSQALLESVADDLLTPNADVVVVYSGFEPGSIDSLSLISLDEHLGRLTVRDLQKLETTVPLETLKSVVDLAVEIGREGRESKRVGTMFVVGDHRQVLEDCQVIGFDPVHGYKRRERRLRDPKVREAIKEIALLDGAFIIAADGTVEASCQMLQTGKISGLTLSRGLGTRHWAGAGITKKTKSLAVVVSESSGTVRLFQDGEVVLRIEPFRRAMKFREFEQDTPAAEQGAAK